MRLGVVSEYIYIQRKKKIISALFPVFKISQFDVEKKILIAKARAKQSVDALTLLYSENKKKTVRCLNSANTPQSNDRERNNTVYYNHDGGNTVVGVNAPYAFCSKSSVFKFRKEFSLLLMVCS
jgi:hypothetical protein